MAKQKGKNKVTIIKEEKIVIPPDAGKFVERNDRILQHVKLNQQGKPSIK